MLSTTRTQDTQPIVIMDSGAGGLTVFDEINRLLPWLPVVYCADNAGFPYGPRAEQDVVQRVSHYLSTLCKQYQPSLVVLACNTASTVALTSIREQLQIPVVGVVPAIKTAAQLSEKRCIGLLATPGTVKRTYTDQLIESFASDCDVIRVASTRLVHLAENKLRGIAPAQQEFDAIVAPFLNADTVPDQVVLGCTHFPLVREELSISAPGIQWVDSGEAIARRVASLLSTTFKGSSVHKSHTALLTGSYEDLQQWSEALSCRGFTAPGIIDS